MLIETRSRTRLPRGLTYPVGAEVVSAALEGIPQYDRLVLNFYQPTSLHKVSDWETGPFLVLSLRYQEQHLVYDRRNWSVDVWAVPAGIAPRVRPLLTDEGFRAAREWMTADHPPIWFQSWKNLSMHYQDEDDRLFWREDGRP